MRSDGARHGTPRLREGQQGTNIIVHAPAISGPERTREDTNLTDTAIIPLKERVVDRFYDPAQRVWRAIIGQR